MNLPLRNVMSLEVPTSWREGRPAAVLCLPWFPHDASATERGASWGVLLATSGQGSFEYGGHFGQIALRLDLHANTEIC